MASFPGAVFTRAAIANGQTSDPSDVNQLADEITAIEDGVINGSAPINSSRITAPGLQITGNSTFTGNVTISGTVTASNLGAVPTVKVTHSAATVYNNGSWFGLDWDTESYDGSAMHSTSANSSRLTFVASTGIYTVGANVTWSSLAAGNELDRMELLLNDGNPFAASGVYGQADQHAVCVIGELRIGSTTDYVTVRIRHDGASTGRVLAESSGVVRSFWAHKVSS